MSSTFTCPSEEDLLSFVLGHLDSDRLCAVEEHVAACAPCGQVIAHATRLLLSDEIATARVEPAGAAGAPRTRSVSQQPISGRIGRYIVSELLGQGGMGVVYAAVDSQLGRRVALKVLRPDRFREGGHQEERLLREARAMAQVVHPNVVVLYDAGFHQGRIYLAMQYVEGTTLSLWLRDHPRPLEVIVRAFVQAGRGLAAAHAAGFVHRDFKPENVILGHDGVAKVADFGLARSGDTGSDPTGSHAAFPATAANLTLTGSLVGTPAYMSPEQIRGEPASPVSDQFSFAVALYEGLVGERPFGGASIAQLADNITSGRRTRHRRVRSLPSRLSRALDRALATSAEDRFASMGELLAELEPFTRPQRRRGRRLVVGAAVGGALAAAAAAGWQALATADPAAVPVSTSPSAAPAAAVGPPVEPAAPPPETDEPPPARAAQPARPVPPRKRPSRKAAVKPRRAASPARDVLKPVNPWESAP